MKRMKKAVVAIWLTGIMILSAACTTSFDASAYVESCLDLLTKCEYEQYVELTERSEEKAIADYEESIDTMMEEFESLGISEELTAGYRTFFEDIYQATKYEVLEAVEDEDGNFTVDVEIEQVTGVFNDVTDELNVAADDYAAELAASGETLDDAAVNEWVYHKLYEILNENIAELTYNEKQTITVHVVLEDDLYTIPEEDYAVIDAALIDLGELN